jgi:hydroxylamine reductase (hybrid-cluster protein)
VEQVEQALLPQSLVQQWLEQVAVAVAYTLLTIQVVLQPLVEQQETGMITT